MVWSRLLKINEHHSKLLFLVPYIGSVLFIAYILFSGYFYFQSDKMLGSILKPSVFSSLQLTVITVFVSLILTVSISLPCAYVLSRFRLPLKNVIETIIDLPIIFPPAVLGIFLLGIFSSFLDSVLHSITGVKFIHTPYGIVLVQSVVTLSFSIRILEAVFDTLDPRIEQVSYSLGAGFLHTLRHITLPIVFPGILAGISIIIVRCIAEFEALMLFVGAVQGKTDVLSLRIFLEFATGNLEGALAVGGISMLLAIVSLMFLKWMEKVRS
jgi:molybdate transport system permease protein